MRQKRQQCWILLVAAGVWLSAGPALAQRGWIGPGGGNNANRGAMRGGNSAGQGGKAAQAAGSHTASPAPSGGFQSRFGSRPVGSVTDPNFAGRLGRTVGGHPRSGVTRFGNVVFPGVHPGIQPSPRGSGIPNINFPGRTPDMRGRHPRGRGGKFRQGSSGFGGVYNGPVIYAVPYYVPVYTEVVLTAPPPEQPRQFDIRNYEGVAPSPTEPQEFAPRPPARPITLLAFKDATIIAVTDYWLQGYSLVYETSLGVRTVVPLERLDFGLTQQLNFERNVPFVLEARP